jgi:hypothetical protein
MRWTDILAAPDRGLAVVDLWEMRDGDHALITNRMEDLPVWFELHPTEVCGRLAYKMMSKLESGWEPGEILDGPNIWRVMAGDRLVWIGESRPDREPCDHVLVIVDFSRCALAVGESVRPASLEEALRFGSLSTSEPKLEDIVRCRAGVRAVRNLGVPRTFTETWALGY